MNRSESNDLWIFIKNFTRSRRKSKTKRLPSGIATIRTSPYKRLEAGRFRIPVALTSDGDPVALISAAQLAMLLEGIEPIVVKRQKRFSLSYIQGFFRDQTLDWKLGTGLQICNSSSLSSGTRLGICVDGVLWGVNGTMGTIHKIAVDTWNRFGLLPLKLGYRFW